MHCLIEGLQVLEGFSQVRNFLLPKSSVQICVTIVFYISLAGVQPAVETPPKAEKQVEHAHALVKYESDGSFICLACSSCAADVKTLAAIPCVPSEVFKGKNLASLEQRVQQERQYLEKLRKLRLLEVQMAQLEEMHSVKKQRQQLESSSAGELVRLDHRCPVCPIIWYLERLNG